MKILICGKGGSGKSTVAALLAESLRQECYRVLVVDAEQKSSSYYSEISHNNYLRGQIKLKIMSTSGLGSFGSFEW